MTLSSDTTSTEYTGTGAISTYPVGLKTSRSSEIVVYEKTTLAATATMLTQGVNYVVSYVSGVLSVTRTAGALPSGYIWVIERDPEFTQESDYRGNPAYNPERYELDFDKSVERDQALLAGYNRTVRILPGTSGFDPRLPNLTPGTVPLINQSGTGWDMAERTLGGSSGSFMLIPIGLTTATEITTEYAVCPVGGGRSIVALRLPVFTGESNNTFFSLTGIPSDLSPVAAVDDGYSKACPVIAMDDGAMGVFYLEVDQTGSITVYHQTGLAWSPSGTKGLPAGASVVYMR